MTIRALLFDKDGTLFDFSRTWNAWSLEVLRNLAGGDAARLKAMAEAIDFDLDAAAFRPQSVVIAGTNHEVAQRLSPYVPQMDLAQLEDHLMRTAAEADLAPAVPLMPLLEQLRASGLRLGVMTNDGEHSARRHLERAGVLDQFDMVIGADSGHGAKPEPTPLLAFCSAQAVEPTQTVMIGDSLHDLIAGRAAGMRTIGVLTGMARAEELHPQADAVLDTIGALPGWLAVQQTDA